MSDLDPELALVSDVNIGQVERQALTDLNKAVEQWGGIIKSIRVLIVCAFIVGTWVATLEFRQRDFDKRTSENLVQIKNNTATIQAITVWQAGVNSSRWSIQQHNDWAEEDRRQEIAMFDSIHEQNRLAELRLQRLEDEQGRLQESQNEIQKDIREKLRVTPSDVLAELQKLKR
jgi:hypothetical protein